MGLANFLSKDKGLSTIPLEDMYDEINRREATENPYPMWVFNDKIKSYINWLCNENGFDVPPSFVGTCLLTAYSTAIGSSYKVSTNGKDGIFLGVWACLLGISSSGKSLAIGKVFEPLVKIQMQFDSDWKYETKGLSDSQIANKHMPTLIYRDVIMQTLVKSIIPDNPKGVLKMADELLEWINGMNPMSKKEGTDEQFWLSTWNCSPYTGIRAGKQKFINNRPFVNIIGGTQYKVVHRFFAKDRDTSGFIFRLLFARPTADRIAEPNSLFQMPIELEWHHHESIKAMYTQLRVDDDEIEPSLVLVSSQASTIYNAWVKNKIRHINNMEDANDKDTRSSILGKIKEYILRFAGILALVDKTLDAQVKDDKLNPAYFPDEKIDSKQMERAIALGEYYFNEAVDIYSKVQTQMVAPKEVIVAAYLLRTGKGSMLQMAKIIYNNPKGITDKTLTKRMERDIKKWIYEYPKVFGAVGK